MYAGREEWFSVQEVLKPSEVKIVQIESPDGIFNNSAQPYRDNKILLYVFNVNDKGTARRDVINIGTFKFYSSANSNTPYIKIKINPIAQDLTKLKSVNITDASEIRPRSSFDSLIAAPRNEMFRKKDREHAKKQIEAEITK